MRFWIQRMCISQIRPCSVRKEYEGGLGPKRGQIHRGNVGEGPKVKVEGNRGLRNKWNNVGGGCRKKNQQETEKSRLDVEREKRKYEERVKNRFLLGQLNDEKIMKKYKCKFKEFVFMCDSCLREHSSNPVCCCKFCFDAAQSKWDKRNRTGSHTEKRTRSNTKRNRTATTSVWAIKKKQRDNRTKTSQS